MSEPPKIKQLVHSGILIPAYKPRGFTISYRGTKLALTLEQEEMALAWVKKLGTEYVKDSVFIKNFVQDFSKALGVDTSSKIEDFDFSEIQRWVEGEKTKRENMSREEKKKLAETRKKNREANKERYGYAILDGERVEIGNYMVEPPCIFMGRGEHPLRGRWKSRVGYREIILNLSPDVQAPEAPGDGEWGGREFDPSALWVAKWRDKLTGKMKYVWIAYSARFKQEREITKFNEALELERLVEKVRRHIESSLTSDDITRRKVATVAYLIDALKLRVGDEKDKDEADTVGAVTLRGSHIEIDESGSVKFDFLGKDSVRWVKTIKPPSQIVNNLRSFIGKPREPVFSGVRSEMVNAFLGEVTPWLTAKVFRTYHASKVVRDYLTKDELRPEDPEFKKKYTATMANLEAAITCNHKRKLPKNWEESLRKKEERLKSLKAQLREVRKKPPKTRAKRVESLLNKIEAAEVKVKLAKATCDYNLGTSLKSYIDPRIYAKWAKELGYDWKNIYPKSLQQKFAWAEDLAQL